MSDLERIKITASEVQDSRVDEMVARDQQARRPTAPVNREPPKVPLYYNPIFVYALSAGFAAFLVWLMFEPFLKETADHHRGGGDEGTLVVLAVFPTMGALIGLFIAMSDALLSRNFSRAVYCGGIGLGVGALAGVIGMIAAIFVFGFAMMLIAAVAAKSVDERGPHGMAFFILMAGRATAWTFAATGMGVGQGIALKSKKLVINGLVGGVLGGFLGGLAFDPIGLVFGNMETATVSRLVGFTVIGVAVGFFTGLVESMAKDAWLHMKAGPLAGKQFVIYKDPTTLGSSPKCDIYLFKDAAIEPHHAELRAVGTRYQIKDLGSQQGTYVNGRRIDTHMLQPGDTVVLGETVLEYSERERK